MCTSVNEVVCHVIPSEDEILKDGDIVNVDVSTIYNGYFSDSSRMFCIGNVSPEKEKLVRVTKECVEIGISKVKPWEPIGNMGHAVHMHALENGHNCKRNRRTWRWPGIPRGSLGKLYFRREQRRDHGAGNDVYH